LCLERKNKDAKVGVLTQISH